MWGGQARPLTPVEAISDSSYLVYGGAGRGPPYTKYEGPNHAPSGVSGHARPPHRVGSSVHFPRVSMLPWVSQRAAPVPLEAAAGAILPMYFV